MTLRTDQLKDLLALNMDPQMRLAVIEIMSRPAPQTIYNRRYEAKKSTNGKSVNLPKVLPQVLPSVTKEIPPIPPKETFSLFSSSKPLLEKKKDSGCAREREFFDAYNVCAKELGWTVAKKLTKPRRASIRRCIDDAGSLEVAFDHLNDFANSKHASGFGAGDNDREWVIGLDYVIRAGKWLEIMEGKFNGVQAQRQGTNGSGQDSDIGHHS